MTECGRGSKAGLFLGDTGLLPQATALSLAKGLAEHSLGSTTVQGAFTQPSSCSLSFTQGQTHIAVCWVPCAFQLQTHFVSQVLPLLQFQHALSYPRICFLEDLGQHTK